MISDIYIWQSSDQAIDPVIDLIFRPIGKLSQQRNSKTQKDVLRQAIGLDDRY